MILIASADEELVKKMGAAIEGRKGYLVKVRDAIEFRHKVHSWQPEVVVVDVRLGGSKFEVMHELPAILEEVRSKPAVVVILPRRSRKAKEAAAEIGVFEVLSLDRPSWLKDLPTVVSEAQTAYRAGLLTPEKDPQSLH